MITEYYTNEEIFKELLKEEQEIYRYIHRHRKEIVRFFGNRTQFPEMISLKEYVSSGGNKYFVFLECKEKKDRKEFTHLLFHSICMYNNGGICVAALNSDFDDKDCEPGMDIFFAHVFSRYRTRFYKKSEISNKELIRIFFMRNIGIVWREGIDEHHAEGSSTDGIVTFDMLFNSQDYLKNEMYENYLDMHKTILDTAPWKKKEISTERYKNI